MKKGKIRWTPALGQNEVNPRLFYKRYSLDYWTDTAIYNYDSMLVSAYYGMKKENYREYQKIPRKDFNFIADSGGYQIWSQGAKLDPKKVLAWMEDNADTGMTLDIPPLQQGSLKPSKDQKTWMDRARKSAKFIKIMHKARQSEDLELLKVIHGSDKWELEKYHKLTKDLDFDGYAFSPKPPTPMQFAITLAYGARLGAKRVHCFLGTGVKTLPVLAYAKRYFDFLSFDSSSYAKGAKYRKYMILYGNWDLSFGRQSTNSFKRLPCDCPVCRMVKPEHLQISERTATYELTRSHPGALISLHNIWLTGRKIEHYVLLSENDEWFIDTLDAYGMVDTIEAVKFLKLSADIGFDDAYDKLEEGYDELKHHKFERKRDVIVNDKRALRLLRDARDYGALLR